MVTKMRIGLIAGGGRLPEYVHEAALEAETLGLVIALDPFCLLYTSPSPRDRTRSRMPSSA